MVMFLYHNLKKRMWIFALVMGGMMSGVVTVNASGGIIASDMPALHGGARMIFDTGSIMYVDLAKRQIIIKENVHVVGQFVVNEIVHTTRLVDDKGNPVDFDSLEIGQWVIVQGYRVAKSKIFLTAVKVVSGTIRKEQRTVERLKP